MVDSKASRAARAAELAGVRAQQVAKERRTRRLVVAGAVVAVVALVGVSGAVLLNESRRQDAVAVAATRPIPGVAEETGLSANHVDALPEPTPTEAAGTLLPPVGGDHDPVPQNCGVYTEPVATASAVHSLEHGAVWIAYRPGLDQGEIDSLTALARGRAYVLLSPFPGLRSPVVLSAWGIQLELEKANDPRVETFLTKYVQGEQTPEPGAACSGGAGTPA